MNTGFGVTTDTGLTNSGFYNAGTVSSGFFTRPAGGTFNGGSSGVVNTATGGTSADGF